MKAYLITAESEHRVVEAENYSDAVRKWAKHIRAEWELHDEQEDPEPEQVQIVSDEPVIR